MKKHLTLLLMYAWNMNMHLSIATTLVDIYAGKAGKLKTVLNLELEVGYYAESGNDLSADAAGVANTYVWCNSASACYITDSKNCNIRYVDSTGIYLI